VTRKLSVWRVFVRATAVVLQHAAGVYMITVQLQIKMYSWNEWLAWLCSFNNAHMQQRTAVLLQHAVRGQIVYMITVQPYKDVQLE
jgi:hypothetical protein